MVATLSFFIDDLLKEKKPPPVSLIINIGILSAIVFLIISFSGDMITGLFHNVTSDILDAGLSSGFISLVYAFVFCIFYVFALISLRYLFFYEENKNLKIYFFIMLVFFILTSLSESLFSGEELSFIRNTFFAISILLIIINSMRISWIAFTVKKEKWLLLAVSVIISLLFIFILINSSVDETHGQMIAGFSPALQKFSSLVLIYGIVYFGFLFFTTMFHIPTADVYDRKAQEVSSLQYFSKLITQVFDYNDLAETIVDITTKVGSAEAAWITRNEKFKHEIMAIKNIAYVDAGKIIDYVFENK